MTVSVSRVVLGATTIRGFEAKLRKIAKSKGTEKRPD
jgi:hypothetical protein